MNRSFAKRTAAGILALTALISGMSIPAMNADAASLAGDVNIDGSVSIKDAVSLQKYLIGATALSKDAKSNADMNSDGRVNVMDLSLLKGSISEPFADTVKIHLSDSGIKVENDTKNVVSVNGGIAEIKASGKYMVDGSISEGQILVNIPDTTADSAAAEITLSGVSITNSTMPCIYSQSADKLKLTVIGENNLTDTASAMRSDAPACIYSLTDLTVTKSSGGTLNITSAFNKGIDCNEDLNLNGGTIVIDTDTDDLSDCDAVKARETVSVNGAKVIIDSSADGIKSTKRNVEIASGSVEIKAGNDAVQAATSIDISGGTVIAGGDRGFRLDDAGLLNITGGYVLATATDYQANDASGSGANIDMNGSSQSVMLLDFAEQQSKNQAVVLSGGAFDLTASKKFTYALVSSPEMKNGTVYSLSVGGTKMGHTNGTSADFTAAQGAQYKAITAIGTATTPDVPSGGSGEAASVVFSGSSVSVLDAEGKAVSVPSNLTVSGSIVTITVPSVLSISGSSSSAQVIVDCDKTAYPEGVVELDLTGAELSNQTASPIYVKQVGDEVQIVAKKGTVNTISDGASHTDTNTNGNIINAAIYAEDDLKIKGSGTLTVNGNSADGIASKNDLKIYNGTINVTAVDDAVRGGDSLTIGNASDTDFTGLVLTAKANGDGLKSTSTDAGEGVVTINGGTVNINAQADGIQGEQDVVINGGDINIYTYQGSGFTGSGSSSSGSTGGWGGGFGGGMGMDGNSNKTENSAKGIKAVGLYDEAGTTWQSGGNITVSGGNITIDSSDDALHCGGSMTITGGQFRIATADDALHSDHDLTLGKKGGAYSDFGIYVTKCYEGVEGQNIYQYSGTVVVKADDDGYNAAGGADGSGNANPGGWGGGFGGGMGSSGGSYTLEISGGIAIVQSASGDHDAFDSNGNLSVTGGVAIANGQEPFDSDGTNTVSGGNALAVSSQSSGTVQAGTQFTVADASGNVIVSFRTMQAMGAVTTKSSTTALSMYTGGTISGGTDLIALDSEQKVYANGTITGGTAVSASAGGSTGGGFNPRG